MIFSRIQFDIYYELNVTINKRYLCMHQMRKYTIYFIHQSLV